MRALRIELIEEKDGQKRVAHRTFEATAILLLPPEVAGEGFLTLARSMAAELDGAVVAKAKAPTPPESQAAPLDRPLTREEEIAQITCKRKVKKKVVAQGESPS